jgi:hypothetical protein
MDSEVLKAVENAKRLLRNRGYDCQVTPEELVQWFKADTPYDQDFGLEKVIANPLIVVHELVEIENVKRMGLALTKDVIMRNLNKVDDAHLKAVEIELQLAKSTKDVEHIRDRLEDIKTWIEDPSVTPKNKESYRKLLTSYLNALDSPTRE